MPKTNCKVKVFKGQYGGWNIQITVGDLRGYILAEQIKGKLADSWKDGFANDLYLTNGAGEELNGVISDMPPTKLSKTGKQLLDFSDAQKYQLEKIK